LDPSFVAELDPIISKFRTLMTGDILLPDDINNINEAIKKIRDILASIESAYNKFVQTTAETFERYERLIVQTLEYGVIILTSAYPIYTIPSTLVQRWAIQRSTDLDGLSNGRISVQAAEPFLPPKYTNNVTELTVEIIQTNTLAVSKT